jgi:hypothetical protein
MRDMRSSKASVPQVLGSVGFGVIEGGEEERVEDIEES